MTVLEATENLFEWYKSNDSFEEKEVSKIILVSDTPDRDRAAFLCALEDMEKAELIRKSTIDNNRTIWTLRRKLESFDQNVEIPKTLALEIATVLNACCETLGDYHDQCDPANISIKDLFNLTFISKTAMNSSQKSGVQVEDILIPPEDDLPSLPDEDEEKN
jgi:hypothetical protein